jgi:class 3 adenylate cyclase/DNA-binding winged helix-turn-helix (wHTH) protein/tetratricopeptide (TPR) repeat protein
MPSPETRDRFQFGGFTLDLARGSLSAAGREIALRPKSFAVLRYLLEKAGRLVSKDELVAAVWPNIFVGDDALARCISDIRAALDDADQGIIKTVPRRGYLLAAAVSDAADAAVAQTEAATPPGFVPPAQIPAAVPSLASSPASGAQDRVAQEPAAQRPAERRQLTLMFCDLAESTALSVRLDPEEMSAVLRSYQPCCTEIVGRFGGFVAKYMGDGILIYFGYPEAHEDDAERAVLAALAIAQAVPQLRPHGDLILQVRVGIATGLVVVGELIGQGVAQELTVVGQTPNLAARLQSAGEADMVVICAGTKRLIGGLFDCRDLGRLSLKGFGDRVPAWQVLGPSQMASRFEALHPTLTPLVGRAEELELMLRRWWQAKSGDGAVVLISGEPGIGKSRLVQTLLDRLGDEPHTSLRFFCSPHHQDSALYPSIVQLERASGIRHDDTPAQKLAKLEAMLAISTEALGEAVPILANLLSIPTGERYPALDLTPYKHKQKTLRALLAQIEGLAARRPLLLWYEDIHWSDPTTRELLDLLIDRAATLRALVVMTFRPEFAPPWIGRPHVSLFNLNRLSPRHRAEMILRVTGGKALPREIADQIIDRTDGVPLFIEELTKSVVESGLMEESGDRYSLTGPVPAMAIPTSLQASLLARLDRLPSAREVAQIAAALGREFSHEVIAAVASMPRPQLNEAMGQLVQAELIYRRGMLPDAEYRFKHALVRDATYSTLLRDRRGHLHGRIAVTLEAQFAEIAAAHPASLARHYAEAGMAKKAVVYWSKAGQQATARSAMTEAEALLRRGLEVLALLPDGPWRRQQELDLQFALVLALSLTQGLSAPEVGELLERNRVLAERLGRPEYLGLLSLAQWGFEMNRAHLRPALSLAEEVGEFGETHGDAGAKFLGSAVRGYTYLLLGEFATARMLLEHCLDLYDQGAPGLGFEVRGVSLDFYGAAGLPSLAIPIALANLGYPDQARSRLAEVLSDVRRSGQAHLLTLGISHAVWLDFLTSSPQTQCHVDELLALSMEHGFPQYSALATIYCGSLSILRGEAQEGFMQYKRGLAEIRASGADLHTQSVLIMLASAHAMLGQTGEGLSCLDEAEQLLAATDARHTEAWLYTARGELLNAAGDASAAERSYHQAVKIAQRQSAKLLELRASISLACLWSQQGKRSEAHDLLAPIYGWFTEGFDLPDLIVAKALLDDLARPAASSSIRPLEVGLLPSGS